MGYVAAGRKTVIHTNGIRAKGAGKGADGTNRSDNPDGRPVSRRGTAEGLEEWMTGEGSREATADGCTVFDRWAYGANLDNLTGKQTKDGNGHGHSCIPESTESKAA